MASLRKHSVFAKAPLRGVGGLKNSFSILVHGWARISTDGLPCGRFSFVHRCTRISTDGLPCGSFYFVHGWTRISTEGFLTEAFVFAKAPLGGLGAKDLLFNTISSGFIHRLTRLPDGEAGIGAEGIGEK